ncbi:MAG: hypothetical protein K9J25_05810 [Bacteroidales bacterium]|nr:hypothetical protein [Bacteroidales bacterium]
MIIKTKIIILLLIFFLISCENLSIERIIKLETVNVEDITDHEAKIKSEIIDTGNESNIEYGTCWSENKYPKVSDNYLTYEGKAVTGTFTQHIQGLEANTDYYARAWAKSNQQTVYSPTQVSFKTMVELISPVVTTDSITDINNDSATIHGTIIELGYPPAVEFGFCWSEQPEPVIGSAQSFVFDFFPEEPTSFSTQITGLKPGTHYFIRAYIKDTKSVHYGNTAEFTTSDTGYTSPTMSTPFITCLTHNGVSLQTEIINSGSETVISQGFCWSETGKPIITIDSFIKLDNITQTGIFNDTISNLYPGTEYYISAFIINSVDTAYSNAIQCITYSNNIEYITDSRDGRVYRVVNIGTQWWMAENLNYYTHSGSSYYNNDSLSYSKEYGRLYVLGEAINACPVGWHLPSDEEWKTLESSLGMSQTDIDATGYRGTDQGAQLIKSDFNTTGFDAVMTGYRHTDGNYFSSGNYAYFWTSTKEQNDYGWYRMLSKTESTINRNFTDTLKGFSVRCVKD